jgi:hypothetical protein
MNCEKVSLAPVERALCTSKSKGTSQSNRELYLASRYRQVDEKVSLRLIIRGNHMFRSHDSCRITPKCLFVYNLREANTTPKELKRGKILHPGCYDW